MNIFKIMGVKARIQNRPETLVATPSKEATDIKGINIIVILVRVINGKLTKADIRSIASIMLENLKSRLLSKSYNLIINEIAIEKVIEEGFNPDYGARPLRRVITNRLEDRLAATILEKNIEPGSTIWIDYRNNEYTINHQNFSNAKDLTTLYNENDKV